jgi:hypothetical protein
MISNLDVKIQISTIRFFFFASGRKHLNTRDKSAKKEGVFCSEKKIFGYKILAGSGLIFAVFSCLWSFKTLVSGL